MIGQGIRQIQNFSRSQLLESPPNRWKLIKCSIQSRQRNPGQNFSEGGCFPDVSTMNLVSALSQKNQESIVVCFFGLSNDSTEVGPNPPYLPSHYFPLSFFLSFTPLNCWYCLLSRTSSPPLFSKMLLVVRTIDGYTPLTFCLLEYRLSHDPTWVSKLVADVLLQEGRSISAPDH